MSAALTAARKRLLLDSVGVWVSIIIVGTIFGFTARQASLSLVETSGLSAILFAGAAQFAVVGLLAGGASWAVVVVMVWLLNARHMLYAASIAPHTARLPRSVRARIAFLLTDEAFALTSAHIARLGRIDLPGAWYAGLSVFVPWNLATIAGWVAGAALPDPATIGLDVVVGLPVSVMVALVVVTGNSRVTVCGSPLLPARKAIVYGVVTVPLTTCTLKLVASVPASFHASTLIS